MRNSNAYFQKTRLAVIWNGVLFEPLLTVYGLLAFILRKDLEATIFQIAVLTMLKPVATIFSLYWSSSIYERRDKLRSNVVWAGILCRVPFLFFPFISNVWVLIGCATFYMMLMRAGGPAWMEILKLNLPQKERGKVFSLGSVVGYVEGAFLAIGVGVLLDYNSDFWRWIFPISAVLGIMGVCLQARVPVPLEKLPIQRPSPKESSFLEKIFIPWHNAFDLMRNRRDFFRFQLGFMICGFGLMVIQPAIPLLFSDILNLSYKEMVVALSICRGTGYALTSPLWVRMLNRFSLYSFTSVVFLLVALYASLLITSQLHVGLVYLAYFVYGVVLAGNHLAWNLSGPIFAKEKDSSLFSNVNVMTVGIRGCVAPPLGGLICTFYSPIFALSLGLVLFIFSGIKMYQWGRPSVSAFREPLI